MTTKYYLGSDIGTSSCKTIIINSNGDIVSKSIEEYLPNSPRIGWAEIDPEIWYQAFLKTCRVSCKCSGVSACDISAIGLTGQMVTLVCVDKYCKPVRPAILWHDNRGSEEALYLKSELDTKITEISQNPINSTFTLPKLLWLQNHEPENFDSIYKILWACDYIRMRLTGTLITDPTNASSSLMYDLKKGEWSKEIADFLKIPSRIFPEIRPSCDIAGQINSEAATATGLESGTPVIVGSGDVGADNIAAGIISPGQGMIRFGTCATISISLNAPVLDKNGNCPCSAHSVPGLYLLQGTSAAFGSSVRWFRNSFYKTFTLDKSPSVENANNFYNLMNKEASEVPAGANDLFFHTFNTAAPYWVPDIRGQFIGINQEHRRGHFARAVFEGTAYDLKEALVNLSNTEIKIPREFIAVGRGALSQIWSRIVSDVLGCNLILTSEADASFGAAMLAGIGLDDFKSFNDAVSKCVKYTRNIKMDTDLLKFYKKQFVKFRKVHKNLVNISKTLHET